MTPKYNILFVDKEECQKAQQQIDAMPVYPVKGTMSVHCVMAVSQRTIYVRDTSCMCLNCFHVIDGSYPLCEGWQIHKFDEQLIYAENSYVVIIYQSEWYVGQIIGYTSENNTYEISCMEYAKGKGKAVLFRWPKQKDITFSNACTILCPIIDPTTSGKGKNVFIISKEDYATIKRQPARCILNLSKSVA